MITIKEFPDRQFKNNEEMFKALKEHKQSIVSLKKSEEKRADAVSFYYSDEAVKNNIVNKSDTEDLDDLSELSVKVVINTTNLLDSHGDVHIDGIWTKSLKDKNEHLHLQEHDRSFDKIISDNAYAYVKSMPWSKLGADFKGNTQALIFDSVILRKRNEFMLNQYANKWVKNHSVGMRYVQMELAINSEAEWDKEEKEIWDKYYPIIANQEIADQRGYFWAVTEAKIIEGSAVVFGSNSITPTLENKQEPLKGTSAKNEPSEDTQNQSKKLTFLKLKTN